NNRSRMTHPAPFRRSLAGNERNHRLAHVLLYELRGFFFSSTPDFPNHDDCPGCGIPVEQPQHLDKASPNNGVSADSNTTGLASAELGQLVNGFVSQSA